MIEAAQIAGVLLIFGGLAASIRRGPTKAAMATYVAGWVVFMGSAFYG